VTDTEFDWQSLFNPGESPYFAMFRCGCMGIKLEDCLALCVDRGIPLRGKDVRSWQDGDWNNQTNRQSSVLNPLIKPGQEQSVPFFESSLDDYDTWPHAWRGSTRRWFPCNEQNMPMQKWGYSESYRPNLYDQPEAAALSPIGWVGQNLYAQPFVVIDIDGDGHGTFDEEVIEFGNRYRNFTETWENPDKPGSFHLYFATDRRIPIGHFPYAKLDLIGNQKNAAVYLKNKVSNNISRATLNEHFWHDLKAYLDGRRQARTHERRETP
jgi:hypothetical protein